MCDVRHASNSGRDIVSENGLSRDHYGMYDKLMGELERKDVAGFRNFIRMEPARFCELLQRISRTRGLGNLWNRVWRCPSHAATVLQAQHNLDDCAYMDVWWNEMEVLKYPLVTLRQLCRWARPGFRLGLVLLANVERYTARRTPDPWPPTQLLRLGVPQRLLLRRVLVGGTGLEPFYVWPLLLPGQIKGQCLLALHGWHVIARLSLPLWGSLHRVSRQMTFIAGDLWRWGSFTGGWGSFTGGWGLVAPSRTPWPLTWSLQAELQMDGWSYWFVLVCTSSY